MYLNISSGSICIKHCNTNEQAYTVGATKVVNVVRQRPDEEILEWNNRLAGALPALDGTAA